MPTQFHSVPPISVPQVSKGPQAGPTQALVPALPTSAIAVSDRTARGFCGCCLWSRWGRYRSEEGPWQRIARRTTP